jgi:hypothetical protein
MAMSALRSRLSLRLLEDSKASVDEIEGCLTLEDAVRKLGEEETREPLSFLGERAVTAKAIDI